MTWEGYLSRLGERVDGYGRRLVRVAEAYEKCDAGAAETLGVALPPDGPSDVRTRPGQVPR